MKHNLDFEKELKLDNPYKYDYSHSDKDEYWEYKRCDLISKYHSKLIESSELQAFII